MKHKIDIYLDRQNGAGFIYEFTFWVEDTGSTEQNNSNAIAKFKELIRADERPETNHYQYQARPYTNPLTLS